MLMVNIRDGLQKAKNMQNTNFNIMAAWCALPSDMSAEVLAQVTAHTVKE